MLQIGTCLGCQQSFAVVDTGPTDATVACRCPHCDANLATAAVSLSPVPPLVMLPFANGQPLTVDQPAQVIDDEPHDNAPAVSIFAQDHVAQSEMPVVHTAVGPSADGGISLSQRRSQQAPATSWLRQLVGIFVGGVVGLAVGYFILLWIGGPGRDFLRVADRLPAWSLPASFSDSSPSPSTSATDEDPQLKDLLAQLQSADDFANLQSLDEQNPPDTDVVAETTQQKPAATKTELLIDPPTVDAAELSRAFNNAQDLRLQLIAGEGANSLVAPAKQTAFAAYCELAHALTFYDQPTLPAGHSDSTAGPARHLLYDTLANSRMVSQIGPLAAQRLSNTPKNSADVGIVIAGRVMGEHRGIAARPGLMVQLAHATTTVAIVGPQPWTFPRGTIVIVAGSVIVEPTSAIVDYTGTAPRVIWAGYVAQVDELIQHASQ